MAPFPKGHIEALVTLSVIGFVTLSLIAGAVAGAALFSPFALYFHTWTFLGQGALLGVAGAAAILIVMTFRARRHG